MKATETEPRVSVHREPLPGAWPGAWTIDEDEVQAVMEVMKAKSPFRHYGPRVLGMARQFEKAFAAKMGTGYALGVTSGTAALAVSLVGMEVGPEDEVIIPAFTWIACPCAAVMVGAVPVLAEVDESLNLDPTDIERRITPRTKAIMVVHAAGVAADMDPILDVARRRGIKVLEDCAQSCGARYRGKYVGSMGFVGSYSLQMNKVITTGEGGAVVTSDPTVYERAVRYHDLGLVREQFEVDKKGKGFFGTNYRMTDLTGAVALVQLRKLDAIVSAMRERKQAILDGIRDLPGLVLRKVPDPAGDACATVSFLAPSAEIADRLVLALAMENVPAGKQYGGKTLYENWPDYFDGWLAGRKAQGARAVPQEYKVGLCPRTEALLKRVLLMSITPILTDSQVSGVIDGIRKAWRSVAGRSA